MTHLRTPDLTAFDPDAAASENAGIFGLPFDAQTCSVLLFGYPWEPTTSYSQGTAHGPQAIQHASGQLDLFDLELARLGLACPYKFGIHLDPPSPQVQQWNAQACALTREEEHSPQVLDRVNELSARFNAHVEQEIGAALDAQRLVGVLGGDHSVPFGALRAHDRREREFGILHIDAHADLRVAYEGFTHSHASIMHNVLAHCPNVQRLVQVGVRDLSAAEMRAIETNDRIETFFGPELEQRFANGIPWQKTCDEILRALPKRVYVSVDIDGLDPVYCPNTGTPVPGGLSFAALSHLLVSLAQSGKTVIGFDLCEVAPPLDAAGQIRNKCARDEWDANVGARVLYRLCGLLLHSHGARNS